MIKVVRLVTRKMQAHRNLLAVLLAVMCLSMNHVYAEQSQFNWLGELGYDFLSNQFESAADTKEHSGLLRLTTTGYLYQPWMATLEGGIGLFFRRTDSEDADSTSDNVVGNARLRLFPQSRFPLEVFAERSDSRTDTDLTGLVIERTRYGFNQRYTTEDGTALHLGYERSDQVNARTNEDNEETRQDLSDLLKASFNKSFGAHTVTFDANANRVDRVDSVDLSKTTFSTLRHAYRPSPAFSAEDMLTLNQSDITLESSRFTSDIYQFNSFGFWRPRTSRPLRINGAIRALTRTTGNQLTESEAQTSSATLGTTYEWTERWLLNANIGLTNSEDENQSSTSSFESISAIYSSRNYRPYGFDANWFGQVDLRNNDDDGDSVQEAGAQLGYNIDRSLLLDEGRQLSFRGSQSINTILDTEDFSSQTLLSSLSVNWSRRSETTSDMARLSFSDTRTIAGGMRGDELEGDFQIINLQASIDNKLSGRSAIMANATVQATRNYRSNIEGVAAAGNGQWTPTSTLDITYYKIGLFQQPRLSFHSTLRFVSNTYLPAVGDPNDENERNDKQWENRIEYNIGRLQFRVISRLSEIQQEKQNYFLFQVRRMLGGY
jgi:hypothetical protein